MKYREICESSKISNPASGSYNDEKILNEICDKNTGDIWEVFYR